MDHAPLPLAGDDVRAQPIKIPAPRRLAHQIVDSAAPSRLQRKIAKLLRIRGEVVELRPISRRIDELARAEPDHYDRGRVPLSKIFAADLALTLRPAPQCAGQ